MALTKIPGSLIDTASGINGLIYPSSDGTAGQFLTTDGSGNLSFATVTTYTDSDVETYLDGGTSTPTFATATVSGTLTVTGDLDLTGDINSYNVTDLDITDQTITLGAGQTEALSGGSGIIVDGSNASILWDETNTEFDINNPIHVAGGITFGTSDSTLADNNVRFKSTGAAYIDHNTVGQDINFRVSNASSLDTTALTIDSSGNVGIGTDNPQRTLHVITDTLGGITGRIESSQANGIGGLQFYNSAGTNGHIGMAGTGSSVWADQFFLGSIADKQVVITQNDTGIITIDTTSNNSTITMGKPVAFANVSGYRHSDHFAEVLVVLPYFTNGTSNLAADIEFGNVGLNSTLEVTLSSSYSITSSIGEIRKKWELGFNTNGTIWGTPRLIEEVASGQIVDEVFMSDPFWDSGDSKYKVRVYHKTNLGNAYKALVRVFGEGTADNVVDNITASSLLTNTSTTSDNAHVRKFSEPIVHAYRAASGTILPTAFVGCDCWYDLSGRHSTIERQGTNNDQLKSCSDASGNSRPNLIKNPQFGSSTLATREAFPSGVFGFRFDTTSYITGTADTSGYLPPSGTNARTLWCVIYNFREDAGQPINHFLHYGSSSTGGAFGIAFTPSSNQIQMHSWAGTGRTVDFDTDIAGGFVDNDTAPTGVWVLFTQIYGDGSGNGETRVYRGAMEGVSNIGSVAGLSTGQGFALHVGSRIYTSNGTECSDSVIGEFGAYNRKLSTKEMDLLANSLLLRWA